MTSKHTRPLLINGSYKFMQVLSPRTYEQVGRKADRRGISIQEIIREVIIPEWLELENRVVKVDARPSRKLLMATEETIRKARKRRQ